MVAVPDPATFQTDPLEDREQAVARMFCDIVEPDGEALRRRPSLRPQAAARRRRRPRLHLLRRTGARILLFQRTATAPSSWTAAGISTKRRSTSRTDFRKHTVTYLEAMGIPVEAVHHEVAPSTARDRPALHRRAHHGRLRHGVPPYREGGGAGVRRLRHLHAEARRGRERQGHAHPPVTVRGRPQRVLRPHRRVPSVARPPARTSPASSVTRRRSPWSRTSG